MELPSKFKWMQSKPPRARLRKHDTLESIEYRLMSIHYKTENVRKNKYIQSSNQNNRIDLGELWRL